MDEKRDRTILIVSIIVIVGILVSLIGAAVSGGLVGYLVARRQVRAVAEQLKWQKPEMRVAPPSEEEKPWHFEFPPFHLHPGEQLSGAWIREVMPDTPADRAGLQEGDLIIAVDGQLVDEEHSLHELIGQHKPGDVVKITYRRGTKEHEVRVKLGKHPDDPERAYLGVRYVFFSMRQHRFNSIPRRG